MLKKASIRSSTNPVIPLNTLSLESDSKGVNILPNQSHSGNDNLELSYQKWIKSQMEKRYLDVNAILQY